MSSSKKSGGSAGTRATEAADDRTLALASPGLTAAKLESFTRYQTAFLDHAEAGARPPDVIPIREEGADEVQQRLAAAEREAQALLSPELRKEIARLSALVADFCGKRWTLRRLEQLRRELPTPVTEEDRERASTVDQELQRLRSMDAFVRRHGAHALSLLQEREDDLLELHQRQQRLLLQPRDER